MKTAYLGAALAFALAATPGFAQNVKITPLGSHDGELCANDRATLFEDPTGVRILYDVGQTLTFSKGEIGFDGASLADPSLNFLASRSGTGVTANLAITGTASSPKITLSSSPPLPQDEVLAQLLLGRSAITLQPLELAQIAAALASLTGATSGIGDPLNSVRTELGLDRLSIGSNGGGSTLNAGRYVAPGVYVGARQSLSGSGTQSVVQIDIAKGLKLEGSLGTGTASATGTQSSQGSGVAVIYERDY